MTDLTIENIVAVLDFHRELELRAVAELLKTQDTVSQVDYTPEENHWLQTRFLANEESKYVAFYRSGTCAIVGCRSFEQLDAFVDVIKTAMDPVIVEEPRIEIKNLVCVGHLKQNIDLAHLAITAGLEQVEYEPEQFPGLIYRGNESDPVLLVFASGKVIITGATTRKAANQSFQDFTMKLAEWGFRD